jgi:hypothetical protein
MAFPFFDIKAQQALALSVPPALRDTIGRPDGAGLFSPALCFVTAPAAGGCASYAICAGRELIRVSVASGA